MYGKHGMPGNTGRFTLPLVCLIVLALTLSVGCKKDPEAVASDPTPPAVTPTEQPAEQVDTQPLAEVQDDTSAQARSLDAQAVNDQGILKSIYFDFDRYEIRPDQRATLRQNATWLTGEGTRFNVIIEGHCDERGTSEYNMALGDRRANSAREYLISLGVPAARIRTISYGEERPADPGHNESAWAKNRRSAFTVEEG